MKEERNKLQQEVLEVRKEADKLIQKMNKVKDNPEVLAQTISLLNQMGEMQEKLQGKLDKYKES